MRLEAESGRYLQTHVSNSIFYNLYISVVSCILRQIWKTSLKRYRVLHIFQPADYASISIHTNVQWAIYYFYNGLIWSQLALSCKRGVRDGKSCCPCRWSSKCGHTCFNWENDKLNDPGAVAKVSFEPSCTTHKAPCVIPLPTPKPAPTAPPKVADLMCSGGLLSADCSACYHRNFWSIYIE